MMKTDTNDFSDSLNPFLVKEFRQGLRSRAFVFGLLWVQASMAVITACRLAAAEVEGFKAVEFFYWLNLVILMHVVLPLRDVFAGDEDRQPGNKELLVLTPSSGDRLMLSKWMCNCALLSLGLVTLLPYHLVHYFQGGVNVVRELAVLGVFAINAAIYVLWAMFAATFGAIARSILLAVMLTAVSVCDALSFVAVAGGRSEDLVLMVCVYFVIGLFSYGITSARYDFDRMRQGYTEPLDPPMISTGNI